MERRAIGSASIDIRTPVIVHLDPDCATDHVQESTSRSHVHLDLDSAKCHFLPICSVGGELGKCQFLIGHEFVIAISSFRHASHPSERAMNEQFCLSIAAYVKHAKPIQNHHCFDEITAHPGVPIRFRHQRRFTHKKVEQAALTFHLESYSARSS